MMNRAIELFGEDVVLMAGAVVLAVLLSLLA